MVAGMVPMFDVLDAFTRNIVGIFFTADKADEHRTWYEQEYGRLARIRSTSRPMGKEYIDLKHLMQMDERARQEARSRRLAEIERKAREMARAA